jgi:hypothetical protein
MLKHFLYLQYLAPIQEKCGNERKNIFGWKAPNILDIEKEDGKCIKLSKPAEYRALDLRVR